MLVLCVETWSTNPPSEKISSALEQFRHTGDATVATPGNQKPPLIQQAEAFALYLNPPHVPPMPSDRTQDNIAIAPPTGASKQQTATTAAIGPPSSSPKFELHGISYYRVNPDRSMALIYEQGGVRRWVRQGDKLGHLLIERIDGDRLVYRDGEEILAMALAPTEAVAQFAQRAGQDAPPRKSPHVPDVAGPAPPALRGLRQIPLFRVAAKLGLTPQEMESFGDKRMEME